MKSLKFTSIILSAILMTGVLTACNQGSFEQEFINTGDLFNRPTSMETLPVSVDLSEADSFSTAVAPIANSYENQSWNNYNYTEITLADGASQVTKAGDYQAGVIIEGDEITIDQSGVFVLKGSLSDGRVVVSKRDNVRVVLSGANITNKSSAPLCFLKGDLKVLTLADGTSNCLTDASVYTKFYDNDGELVQTEAENKINGCLYSQHELTINGNGLLKVSGNAKNGISVKSRMKIISGEIEISAKNNGLRAKAIDILGGQIVVKDSGGDGIKSIIDNDLEENQGADMLSASGFINLLGGNVSVNAAGDGIQAETLLRIDGDSTLLRVKSGGGAGAAYNDLSSKGLKSTAYLLIEQGNISVDSRDDALHADLGIIVTGGKCVANTASKGVNGTVGVLITGGRLEIESCEDGLEALSVTLMGGTVKVTARSNAIKCELIEESSPVQSDADCAIIIGGNAALDVTADGDVIKGDGKILINGGELYVDGPRNHEKSVMEAKQGVAINGGTVYTAGGLGRAQDPVEQSTAYTVSLALNKAVAEGSTVKLCDSTGKILISRETVSDVRAFTFAHSKITEGATLIVLVNDKEVKRFTITAKHSLIGANL